MWNYELIKIYHLYVYIILPFWAWIENYCFFMKINFEESFLNVQFFFRQELKVRKRTKIYKVNSI